MVKEKKAHVWPPADDAWYVEPERVTRQLLAVESFVGTIVDPCCGQGNIVKTLIANGYAAVGNDIIDRTGGAGWFGGIRDYLGPDHYRSENTVMNPPYFRAKGAEAFIRRALEDTQGKIAAFVDSRFLYSEDRANGLYVEHPPTMAWLVTPRPSCPPGEYIKAGGKVGGGQPDFAWLVWDKTSPSNGTQMGWLR